VIVQDNLQKIEQEIADINLRLMNVRRSAGGGEINTASNQGAGGVGVYDAKVGVDLQFRNINAASAKITVVHDAPNKEIDIDVDPSQIFFNDLGDINTAGKANNDIVYWNAGAAQWQVKAEAGGGDVVGPGASTDHAIARFNGVTGKLLQNSPLSLITDAPVLFLNETVNTKMNIGLTIHQGTYLTEIISLKGTNINHGITGETETDTFFMIKQTNPAGGAYFYGFEEAGGSANAPGASLRCYTKTSRTDHSTAGHATMMAYGAYCGGSTTRVAATAGLNIFGIRTYDSYASWKTLHLWAEDGEQFIWGINPKIFINDVSNAKMTIGITVNQGTASNEIQAGKASNINHGITSRAEADTFYKFQQVNANYGGLNIEAYQEVSGGGACLNLGAHTKTDKHGTLGPTNPTTINLQAVYCGGGTDRMPAPAGFVLVSMSTYDSTGNWRHKWQCNQEGNTWQLGVARADGGFSDGGNMGVNGVFTAGSGETITVSGGIITGIV